MSHRLQGLPLQSDQPTLAEPEQALPEQQLRLLNGQRQGAWRSQVLPGLLEHRLPIQNGP